MKRSPLKKYGLYIFVPLLSAFAGLWISFGGNAANSYFERISKAVLPDVSHARGIFWILGTIFLLVLAKIIENYISSSKEVSLEDRKQLLSALDEQYEKTQSQKMDDVAIYKLDLSLTFQDEHTPAALRQQFIEMEKLKIAGFDDLFELYQKRIKRLLILADAGSGKSILLLNFATELLKKAKADENYPIPIIFDLSMLYFGREETFAVSLGTNSSAWNAFFDQWILSHLQIKLSESGMEAGKAKRMIEKHQVVYLFDGLDEVGQHTSGTIKYLLEYIDKLVNKIRMRGKGKYPELLVACRKDIYHSSLNFTFDKPEKIPFHAVVDIRAIEELMPMLDELMSRDPRGAAERLIEEITRHPTLGDLLHSAFYVHCALKLVQGSATLGSIDTEVEILDRYVQQQLNEHGSSFAPERAKRYMHYIQRYLVNEKSTPFFSASEVGTINHSSFASHVMIFLLHAPIFYTLFCLFDASGLFLNAKNLPISMAFIATIVAYISADIYVADLYQKRYFNFKDLIPKRLTNPNWVNILIVAAIVYLLAMARFEPVGASVKAGILLYITTIYLIQGSAVHTTQEKAFNGISNFCITFLRFLTGYICLFFGIYFLFQLQRYKLFSNPEQALFDWVRFIHLDWEERYAFVSRTILLITLITTLQQTKILTRLVIHTLLWLKGHIPLRLDSFLRAMKKAGLLIEQNGQYRFRHLLIQGYFKDEPLSSDDLGFVFENGEISGVERNEGS